MDEGYRCSYHNEVVGATVSFLVIGDVVVGVYEVHRRAILVKVISVVVVAVTVVFILVFRGFTFLYGA